MNFFPGLRHIRMSSDIPAFSKLLLLCFLLIISFPVLSQDIVYWRSESTTGDWDWGSSCDASGSDGHWHYTTSGGGERKRPDCYSTANIIHFDNTAYLTMNLNSTDDFRVNQIQFDAGTGPRIINTTAGRTLRFWQNSGNAKIENRAPGTTQTFNVTINVDNASTWMEFNPVSGYMTINGPVINNSGNTIHVFGNQNVTFSDDISSTTGTPGFTVNGNARAVFSGTSKTYSGATTIKNGATLQISSDQSLGDIVLESGGTLIIDAGITLTITGSWTGGGSIENNGKIILAGPSAFPGSSSTITAMNDLTINKAAGVSLDKSLSIGGTLTLSSGRLDIGANILTMSAASPAISGSFSSSCMIVADGGGEVRKAGTSQAQASYTFPVGDNSSTAEYSPISLTFSGGTYSGYSGVKVTNTKHPQNKSITNYLNRFWTVSQSGFTGTVSVSATYVTADIVGTEAGITSAEYTGSDPWIKYAVLGSNTLTASNVAAFTSADFSGVTNPTVSVSPGPVIEVCQNSPSPTLTATAAGAPTLTYLWSPGGATTSAISPSTATVGSTVYSVTITDGNGLTATTSVTVTVNALPSTSLIYHQ